jgi:hypothetical protein
MARLPTEDALAEHTGEFKVITRRALKPGARRKAVR